MFLVKNPKISVMPGWVDFSDLGWTNFWLFYAFKWYRRYYWKHFISADWVYKRKFEIFSTSFVSLCFWSKIPKNLWCRHGSILQIRGENNFCDFMLSKDTEDTTEDILSVRTGYISESLRFLNNFVSLWFLVKNPKTNCDAGMGQFFRFGVKIFSVILCFQMIQKILPQTFYQCGLGI